MAEQFRQIKRKLAEQFRQIKRKLAEQFRQIKHSLVEPHMEISFWFGKGNIPNEKILHRNKSQVQVSLKVTAQIEHLNITVTLEFFF